VSVTRRREILMQALATSPTPLTIQRLGLLVQASPRTIRYDLDELADWLEPQQIALVRKPRRGIWLTGSPAALDQLRSATPAVPLTHGYLSAGQQQALATTRLLATAGPVAITDLSALMGVTRTTVYRYLDRIADWLRARSLHLSHSRVGVAVDGGETIIRHSLYELLHEWVVECDMFPGADAPAPSVGTHMLGVLGEPEPARLKTAVSRAASAIAYPLTPLQTIGLIFWTMIVQARTRCGGAMALSDAVVSGIKELPEYRLALDLLRQIGLPAASREAAFLAIQARAVRFGPSELTRFDLGLARARARDLALHFIRQASQFLGIDLTGDEELTRGLILHLEPSLDRLELGVVLSNPLLDEIRRQYGSLFAVARQAGKALEPLSGSLPDAEIGFLAVHLGAAMERLTTASSEGIRAVLVCAHGVGTAQLLASLLTSRLPELKVCGFASAMDADSMAHECRAEVFITTRPLVSAHLPVFLVQPIPDAIELSALRSRLQSLRRAPRPTGAAGAGSNFGGDRPLMLNDVLTKETIALDVAAADWKEAIRRAGEPLVRTGAVRPEYIEGMIRGVLTIGPYIVVGPGIAMPHARPEDGALRVGLSCVRLSAPVVFADKTENPVDLVFAFAAIDNHSHITVVGQLAQLLSDPDSVVQVRSARTVDEVLAVIHSVSAA